MLLSHISSLILSSGHLVPVLTLRTNYAACASLLSSHLLLYHFYASSCSLACILWDFFFLQFILPSEIPKFPTDMPVRGFPTVWKHLLLHDTLSRTVSIPKSFVSVSIFYILSYLLSKRLGCLSGYLVSSASIQTFFCGSCTAFKLSFDEFLEEKLVSPFYSSTIFGWLPNSPFIC